MIVAGQRLPILIATRPVDFRCGHRALALIVQTELKLDPHSGVTIVFRSKRGDRLKILVRDDEEDQETVRGTVSPTNGLVMIYKILEQGSFAWPKVQDGVMRLSRAQFGGWTGGGWLRDGSCRRLRQDDSVGLLWRCFIGLSCSERLWIRMSQPFDLSRFPDLPPEVVKAFEAAQFELSVERAARQHEQAVVAEKDAFIIELKDLIAKLEGQVQDYRRTKFGPKSEKLDPAQLELALEDLETAIAETQEQIAAVEEKIAASAPNPEKKTPRKKRKARALPEHLPRVERVIEPESIAWLPLERHWSERQWRRGCGDMVRIGEDRVERLDYIPARYQVIVTIRPKYACPKGRAGVVQAKAPAHLLEE